MAGRYLITGVQLGMLLALDGEEKGRILGIISKEQFIGNSDNDIKEDIKWHEKAVVSIKKLKKK